MAEPGQPGGSPAGAFPGSDPGAPADLPPSSDDYLPAVPAGSAPSPSPNRPLTSTPTWDQVTANPKYQQYSDEQKRQARYQYFDEVVKPRVPQDKWAAALHQFEAYSAPKAKTPDGKTVTAPPPVEDQVTKWARAGMPGPPPTGKPAAPGALAGFGPMLDKALKAVPATVMDMTAIPEAEAVLHAATGAVSGVAQAFEGGKAALDAPAGLGAKAAADKQQQVAEEITYQPRTATGKTLARGVDFAFGIVPKAAGAITEGIAENETVKRVLGPKGAEYAEAGANTAIQAIPTLLGLRGAKAKAGGESVAAAATRAAEGRAREFVSAKTALNWDELPKSMQEKLVAVAKDKDKAALDRLKPAAIERQAAFEKAELPARRGQIERDVAQLTHEDTLSRGDSGEPLQAISSAQDTRLHQRVDAIRKETGAKAITRQDVGHSVEGALRGVAGDKSGLESPSKAVWSEAHYNHLYDVAKETQPGVRVSPEPLYDLFDKNPTVQDLGFVKAWLNKAKIKTEGEPGIDLKGDIAGALKEKASRDAGGPPPTETQIRQIPLSELDDLRKRAVKAARAQDTPGLHAGEVVAAIDKIFDQLPASATAWKKARAAYKAHKIEFEDQALVRKLTEEKSRTDPETALENTGDVFRKASVADIKNLRKSLTTGGTAKTRAAGEQAWKDLQASMLDHLKEKAAGKRAVPGADEQLPFSATFRDEFMELDKDGKIDAIFSPAQAKALRQINKDVGAVRTQPLSRISGPATVANLRAASERNALKGLSVVERASLIPKVGPILAGGAKALRKLVESGQGTRDVARAQTSRLDEAAERAGRQASKAEGRTDRRARRRRNTLKSLQASSVSHGATLKDDDDNKR